MLLNLTSAMKHYGISRRELASMLGLSERAFFNKIHERNDFSLRQMLIIQKALSGLSIDHLFESYSGKCGPKKATTNPAGYSEVKIPKQGSKITGGHKSAVSIF